MDGKPGLTNQNQLTGMRKIESVECTGLTDNGMFVQSQNLKESNQLTLNAEVSLARSFYYTFHTRY